MFERVWRLFRGFDSKRLVVAELDLRLRCLLVAREDVDQGTKKERRDGEEEDKYKSWQG